VAVPKLDFTLKNSIIKVMMTVLTGKHLCKKSLAVLLCLFLIGNVAHGTVLCFGADGHIEFESAFHTHCDEHSHNQSSDHELQLFETVHEGSGHCGPCVDVPVTVDIVKISPFGFSDLDSGFSYLVSSIEYRESGIKNPIYSIILPTTSRALLRTVILLI